ncbi:MAG TPA: 5-oxoprolinase subunit PxpA [Candidatus Sulfotelmatobacter sp.]|nr:5-oxoprolinase subunit PxpA [Candidatus Sulfotelmatobacter sp.]
MTERRTIDLNADVGEGFGPWRMGHDSELMAVATSVNVACGAHAGDPVVLQQTLEAALRAGLAVGAHPGYPDRQGFGRRAMALSPEEIEASVLFQVAAVEGVLRALGGTLHHVKAHGALYNEAAGNPAIARPIVAAVRRIAAGLILVGPPGSALLAAAVEAGLPTAAEGFADRAYEPDGTLRSRRVPGALLTDPAAAAEQALRLAATATIQTICVHSDTPGAPAIAAAVRLALEGAGYRLAPVARAGPAATVAADGA